MTMGSESSAAMQERPQFNSSCILQCLDFVTTGLIGIAALLGFARALGKLVRYNDLPIPNREAIAEGNEEKLSL